MKDKEWLMVIGVLFFIYMLCSRSSGGGLNQLAGHDLHTEFDCKKIAKCFNASNLYNRQVLGNNKKVGQQIKNMDMAKGINTNNAPSPSSKPDICNEDCTKLTGVWRKRQCEAKKRRNNC